MQPMIEKNHLLRYLFAVILAAIAFAGNAKVSDLAGIEPQDVSTLSDNEERCIIEATAPQFDFYASRHVFGEEVLRPQGSTTKPNTSLRGSFDFIKAGKVLNVGIINLNLKQSVNIRYSFIKPAHRLFSLGRLII